VWNARRLVGKSLYLTVAPDRIDYSPRSTFRCPVGKTRVVASRSQACVSSFPIQIGEVGNNGGWWPVWRAVYAPANIELAPSNRQKGIVTLAGVGVDHPRNKSCELGRLPPLQFRFREWPCSRREARAAVLLQAGCLDLSFTDADTGPSIAVENPK